MTMRAHRVTRLATAALVTGLVFAGCGDDSDDAAGADWVEEATALCQDLRGNLDADEDSQLIEEQDPFAGDATPEVQEAGRRSFATLATELRGFADDLEDIDADIPDSDALDDLLAALRTGADRVEGLADQIGTEVTEADFEEAFAWTEESDEHAATLGITGGLEGCGDEDAGS
jgi:hypothetical protein